MLLGTLIAFAGLNQHSEVVAMKAAGLSAHQILAPLIVASLGVAGLLFAFNELVVVNSARTSPPGATPTTSRSRRTAASCPTSGSATATIWSAPSGRRRARPELRSGVTIYDREGGAIARVVEAERADPQSASGWRLDNVRIYDSG